MKPAEDWKHKLERVLREHVPGYNPWDQAEDAWLDHGAALDAINFFAEHLKHVEGSTRGEPFVLRPWQAAAIGNLFGWKRTDDAGRVVRRYRKSLLYVPRGNGKTPLAAGIVLCAFFTDQEPGSQCYLAAGKREQAGYLFRNASGMVDQDPELSDLVEIYRNEQASSFVLKDDPLSFCKTIPAEAAGQHGGIPHVVVIDELHVQENRDLVDAFETGMAKRVRSQPMLVCITTADYERESICNEVYAHACRVRDNGGKPDLPGYDPTFLPVIYEAGAEADWRDEAAWKRANPNIGYSVSLESLRELCRKAESNPAFENTFRRLHLNQQTKQEFKIISTAAWDGCGRNWKDEPLTIEKLLGRPCYLGMDLASTEDLASIGAVFPLADDWLAFLSFSFCPEARIVRRARQKFPYDVWARSGYGGAPDALPKYLTATAGDWIDYDVIRAAAGELGKLFGVKEIGYDPHGATQLVQDLMQDGFTVVPITQTFRHLAAPTKELLRRVNKGRIVHFGNPVLKWAIGNAAAHFDGKLPEGGKLEEHMDKVPFMLSKRKSTDKIDPAAAIVLGLARMGEHPQDDGASVYESRGVRTV